MTALMHASPARRRRPRAAVLAAALLAGTGLLAAGCTPGSASSSAGVAARAVPRAPAPTAAAGGATAGGAAAAPGGTSLAALAPAGTSIIYTASMTVRAPNVTAAAGRAGRLAIAAGGYVSSETTHDDHASPAQGSVSIQLKIPVAAYQATLTRLSAQVGTRLSLSQRSRDVTQAVADVTSRVASAHAAIAQLRRLLARTGSVASLLSVQDQINQQEAALEALLSQQRALAHETAYATVSLLVVSAPRHHAVPATQAGGFTGGLRAGWRAFRTAASWLLTVAGAVLPFAVFLAVAGLAAYRAWRWLGRHRAGPRPAG